MSDKLNFIKLNLKATAAHRLWWNNQYFNMEAILLLNDKIKTKEQAQKNLENANIIFKLNPFRDEFKAKLFSHILNEDKEEKSQIIAFTLSVNIFEKKVLDILDIRESVGIVSAYGNAPVNPNESLIVKLSPEEKESLIFELEKMIGGNMAALLNEPFVCFFPELIQESYKDRLPKNRSKTALVPFQGLFPFSGPLERIVKDELYVLDDLYCTTPSCDCNEVNCVIISFDEQSSREVAYGGFKYNFEKKSFKIMNDFPNKLNSAEWFKQFDLNSPIDLPLLFEARYKYLRH